MTEDIAKKMQSNLVRFVRKGNDVNAHSDDILENKDAVNEGKKMH